LPPGLILNVATGTIEGTPLFDPSITYPATYHFRLEIYNYSLNQVLDFSIEVDEPLSFKTNKLTVRITEFGKIDWYTLRDINLIPSNALYRPADVNFGMNTLPEVVILSEIDNLTPDAIISTLSSALTNIIPTTLTPTNFIFTPVTDANGNTICEAVSLKLQDDFRRSAVAQASNVTEPLIIGPAGLEAIRHAFITAGTATNALENWMNYYFTTNLATNQFIINDILPEFFTGDAISFNGQTLPSPFENNLTYYVIPVTSTTFMLAATQADAFAGTFIPFNVNATTNVSGTLQFYFPALPLAYVKTGQGSAIAAAYNAEENIVPFGYYTLTSNNFTDTFFGTLSGHNLNTGDSIKFWDEPLPGPFKFGYTYYVIVVNPFTFKLAISKADALLGNAITITDYIDNRTNKPFSGSFKKLLSTDNGTVILDEADTRFSIYAEMLWIDSRSGSQPFTATSNILNLPGHGLENTQPIKFENQTNLPAPLENDIVYYAIVIDNDNFKLAASAELAANAVNLTFANFKGFLSVDVSKIVFINEINTFEFSTIAADNVFISGQISSVETGDIVQLSGNILAPFTALTNYSVIRMAADKSFQLATIAAPTVPLVLVSNFTGKIILSNPEYDVWRS